MVQQAFLQALQSTTLSVALSAPTTTPAPGAPVEAAPWWGVPLVAGVFALIGAIVAFLSAYLSDRRKLKREDQRQWDREIRDLYVAAVKETAVIRESWGLRFKTSLRNQDFEPYFEATANLRDIGRSMEIVGAPATIVALDELQEAAHGIVSRIHDGSFDKQQYKKLHESEDAFLHAVKQNLRVEKHSPRPFWLR